MMRRLRHLSRSVASFAEKKHLAILSSVVGLVVVCGILYSFLLGNNLRYPDEHGYYQVAINLATQQIYSSDGQHPTAFQPPGYPLLLWLGVQLGAGIVDLRAVNFVVLALSVILLYLFLKREYGVVAGVAGPILLFFYPVLFYAAGTLYPQTLGAFLFLVLLFGLTDRRFHTAGHGALLGLASGCLILTIPSFAVQLVILALWVWFRRRAARFILVLFSTVCIVLGIWTVRNYIVFDSVFFVSTNAGINLLRGNSEHTEPNSGVNVDISEYDIGAVELNEVNRDIYYRSRALDYVRENKTRSVLLYFRKVLNYFNFSNELWVTSEGSFEKDAAMLVTYGTLLVFVLLRFLLFRRYQVTDLEKLLFFLYVSNAFVQAIFFTRIRLRLPFDFLLISLAAAFVARLLKPSDLSLGKARVAE
ncbi:MAG: hypothetical protein WBH55_05095 [Bacteroidota bacterium]